jgi:hypothetical protein
MVVAGAIPNKQIAIINGNGLIRPRISLLLGITKVLLFNPVTEATNKDVNQSLSAQPRTLLGGSKERSSWAKITFSRKECQ